MIKVGIAGIGFMGWIHWLSYQQIEGIQVAAIATPEPERRAGDWTAIQGNFGPPGEQVDLSGIATYSSLDEMLGDSDLDLIDLCLPPAMHSHAIVKSAAAGKHVFCEKPLALNLGDCDQAIASCQQFNRLLMVGHVLPFFTEFQFARQQIESGKYGRLLGGTFKRVISDPTWLSRFYDPDVIGGPLFDLHVHDAHFIRLLFGMPTAVESSGRVRGSVVEYCNSLFRFTDPSLVVSSTMGVINQQGRPFVHGFEIHLEEATLQFEFSAFAAPHAAELSRLKVLTADGQVIFPELGNGDPLFAFQREIQEVATCVAENRPSKILTGQLARDAVEICEQQAQRILNSTRTSLKYVTDTIRARRTCKILADPATGIFFSPASLSRHDAIVKQAIKNAGLAPFHFPRGVDNIAEPWRVHVLKAETCRRLAIRFPEWFEVKPSNKLPAMLAACGCVVLVTWLPQFRAESPLDSELSADKKTEIDDEHLASTAAFTQNLLTILTAADLGTYWSSGGQLGSPEMFGRLGIAPTERLLAAVFVEYPAGSGTVLERLPGKNHALRSPAELWSDERTIEERFKIN